MDIETPQLKETDFPICVLSDLHSDLDALKALQSAQPDVRRRFCVGDFVDFRNHVTVTTPVLQKCIKMGVMGVRGNHDNAALTFPGILSKESEDFFWNLPDAMVFDCPFGRIGLFHATPASDLEWCNEESILKHVQVFKSLQLTHVLVGHIHRGYTIEHDGLTICNLGHLAYFEYGEPEQRYLIVHSNGTFSHRTLK